MASLPHGWIAIRHQSQSLEQLVPVICKLIHMGDADVHVCMTLQPGILILGTSLHMALGQEFDNRRSSHMRFNVTQCWKAKAIWGRPHCLADASCEGYE